MDHAEVYPDEYERIAPPRGEDLPTEDGIPMESQLHLLVMTLLIESLELFWTGRQDFFVGGNMCFYYSALQSKVNDFRGPDFFVVLDTEHKKRESWVMWEEGGKAPNLILEILSRSTESKDRGEKMRIYERSLRIPEYFLYDPRTGVLEGYHLVGRSYESIPPTAEGRLASNQLGLLLGVEACTFMNYPDRFVRFYTPDGLRLPSGEEQRAEAERQWAEAERQRAEAERQAAALMERLREYERRFGSL
jgi:Uma2 family endonuclease